MSKQEEGASREEGAPAQHARLQQAPGRPQEELYIMAARKLRQAGVQLCGDHHRSGQVGVHLHRRAQLVLKADTRPLQTVIVACVTRIIWPC